MDELEIFQSGPYLLLLAVFLIILSKAVDNQKRIALYVEKRYAEIEVSIEQRLFKRQLEIQKKREQLKANNLEIEELKKLREELEQELHRAV